MNIKQYEFEGKKYYQIQLSFQDKNGRRHQPKIRKIKGIRISSLAVAQAHAYKTRDQRKAEADSVKKPVLTLRAFHNTFLEAVKLKRRNSTYYQYDGDLKKWLTQELSDKPLDEITNEDIQHLIYVDMREKGASDLTMRRISRILRTVFNSAMKRNLIRLNPTAEIEVYAKEGPKQVLNTQEAEKLLSEAKKVEHPFYFHWAFGLLSGMRSGEMYSLRWQDVDMETGNINIHSSWSNKDGYHSTKSKKDRVLPISKELRRLLLELKYLGPFSETLTGLNGKKDHFDDLVLPRSSAWKHGTQSKITKQFCEIIGIKTIKFHDCRSTFITNLLAQGVHLPQVMSVVGHADVETTNRYLRLAGVDVKGVTDRLAYSLPEEAAQNVLAFQREVGVE